MWLTYWDFFNWRFLKPNLQNIQGMPVINFFLYLTSIPLHVYTLLIHSVVGHLDFSSFFYLIFFLAPKIFCIESVSHSVVSNSATPRTVARQAPLSVDFSRQEYCSWYPFSSPGDIPNSGIKPGASTLQVGSLLSQPPVVIVVQSLSCVWFFVTPWTAAH